MGIEARTVDPPKATLEKPARKTLADNGLMDLCSFFIGVRRRGERAVLATIVRTEGSTYRKAGAQILISESGASSGLLSGGCMEADLHERAMQVLASGQPARVFFDTRGDVEDTIFGVGAGCEGANDIWLEAASAESGYASLPYLAECLGRSRSGRIAIVIGGEVKRAELGRHVYPGASADDVLSRKLAALQTDQPRIEVIDHDNRKLEVFLAPVVMPPALLVCGGGPDARPVAQFAAALGWRVTVYDHRPAFADAKYFPSSTDVLLGRAAQLLERVALDTFDAAIIMSHHLPADIDYLRCMSSAPPDFIGILGPAARRARLLAEVGASLEPFKNRIRGPVGLDIGARTPVSIALSIIAEIHGALAGRGGSALADSRR